MWYITFMLPIVLALTGAIAWGSADFLGGRASRAMSALGVAAISKVFGLIGVAILCVALTDFPGREEALWAAGAGIAGAAGIGLLYRALALGPMSLVAPLTACSGVVPVAVALAGGETPGPLTAAGLVIAFVGGVIVSRPSEPQDGMPGMEREGLLTALAAALGIGISLTFLQQAASAPGDATLGLTLVMAIATVVTLGSVLVARGGPFRVPGALLPAVVACGVLDVSANALFAKATADGEAAVVAVLASLYPVGTVLMARVWLGERLSAGQSAGVVFAMVGVAAIAAGS